ncbi:SAM-dependent methyltransferase [Frankia gtarii]|uniref:SAM-dependent methyltransferase n=1 Tax=Frankia gtarii TaxID=2950102 RepID=UPI003F6825FB
MTGTESVLSTVGESPEESGGARAGQAPDGAGQDLKIDVPHPARMYDYFLGGKDNFPADRKTAEQVLDVFPNSRIVVRQNRLFMTRTTRYLAAELGVRQFLDIGTGIPTSPNLHEVAQNVAPDARIVYTDNDPIVLAHARALLASTPQGRTAYIDADLRDTRRILTAPELHETLDLTRPIALSLIAIFHFIPDGDDPYGIMRHLVDLLPSGSYVSLTHLTADFDPAMREVERAYLASGVPMHLRTRAQVERFFDGLDLVEPGLQIVHRWRPEFADPAETDPAGDGATATDPASRVKAIPLSELTDAQVSIYGAVGYKP